jgi:Pyruvate/2-oxoacid:ferredoxin oxidoreductase delta subunit
VVNYTYAIDEANCIECGQCRRYCPVAGAIIINEQYQHTVVTDICTGCGICEAFCPVPNTLYKVEKPIPESVPCPDDYLEALRRVVWRGRWRYHEHPVMHPLTYEARGKLRVYNRIRRASKKPLHVVGTRENAVT